MGKWGAGTVSSNLEVVNHSLFATYDSHSRARYSPGNDFKNGWVGSTYRDTLHRCWRSTKFALFAPKIHLGNTFYGRTEIKPTIQRAMSGLMSAQYQAAVVVVNPPSSSWNLRTFWRALLTGEGQQHFIDPMMKGAPQSRLFLSRVWLGVWLELSSLIFVTYVDGFTYWVLNVG